MPDEVDIANNLIDLEVKRALEKMRGGGLQNLKGSKFCVACDDIIPDARQKLGFNLCVPCAQERERRKSLFADE
jgi:RNA polymerase-binding transcription factor DksA